MRVMGPFDSLLRAELSYKIGVVLSILLILVVILLLVRMRNRRREEVQQAQISKRPIQIVPSPSQSHAILSQAAPMPAPPPPPSRLAKKECPSCHFNNFEDAVFCSMCGFSFYVKEEEKKVVQEKPCLFCGKPMPLDASECPSCKKGGSPTQEQLEEEKKKAKLELRQLELRYATGQMDPSAYKYTKEQLKLRLVDIEDKITEAQVHRKMGKD
jgi:thiol-disulfide isomerase/thioredoxin